MCKPKVEGALGFGKISMRKKSLFGKWLCKFLKESNALWYKGTSLYVF